ncbi:MAG: hypothetical protein RIT27_922 [Pseudomonadota bacterium]|jgi:uncharacterized repeat protein (TIGR01451 family)
MIVGNFMYLKRICALSWAFFLGIASTVSAIGFNEAQLNGVNDITGLNGAVAVAVSPDGGFVYAAGFSDKSIATFSRQSNGKLTFVETYTNTTNLNGINNLIISADGKFVYVAALFGNGIAIFSRDANGHLTFVELFTAATGLTQVNNLSLSFDNKFLYTTSAAGGVAVFSRHSSTGLLTAVETKSLSGAVALTNSPDNKHLYVCAGDALSFFSRDTTTGRLTLMGDYRNGINDLIGLGGAYDVAISPDGSRVYVAANSDNAVTVFNRNADGSLSFLNSYNADTINGLFGVRALAISPDNKKLYAAGSSQHTLVEFDVNSTGLAYRSQLKDGIAGVSGIAGISDVAVSPDNQTIYATGLSSNGLGVFNAKTVDISVTQTLPTEGLINTAFSAKITIQNSILDSASNVVLTDTLPAGVTINSVVPSQGTCSPSGNTLTCALGNLAANATATVNMTLTPTAAGILNHNPRVSSTEPDNNLANNQNTASINVLSKILQADVDVTLTPSADLLNSNSDLVYSVAVKNKGADDAALTVLNMQLPDLAVFSRVETSQGTCANASQTLKCDLGLLTKNATANVTLYLVTPTAIADLTTTATVSASTKDPDLTNNSATSTVKVQPVYTDLTVSKLDAQTTNISLGQSAVLTATFANLSTINTSNVTLGITFSPSDGARFLGATTSVQVPDSQRPCTEVAAGQLKCALGTFNANSSPQTLQLSLYPLKSGTLNVAATISANATDTDSVNNSQNINLNVTGDAVDLSVTQSATPNPPPLDNPLTFNILVTNNHDTKKATNVRLTDTLPLGVDFIGVLSSQGTCSENAGIINCLLGEVQPKSTATMTLSVRPRNLGNLQHSVQVSSDTFDPISSNNSQTLLLNVSEPKIDLESLLTVDKTSILPGDELVYQLKVSNKGAAQADTVLARFQIPSILAISSVSTDQGNCSTNLQEINCSLGTVFSGKSVTMTVRTIAQQAGSGDVSVEAAGLQQDTNPTNNKTSLKTTVNLPPALFYVATWQTPNLAGATDLTFSFDYKNLYVAAFNANQVTAFSRDADGKLQEIQAITHPNLQRPISIVTTGDGKWVIVAAYANNSLEVFRRNLTTGELVWQQSLKAPDVLSGPLNLTAFGQTVYVAGLATKNLVGFQIDSNGSVSALSAFKQNVDGVSGLDGVSAMAISQDGSRLYLTSLNDNALTVFNRAADGHLSFVQSYKNALNGAAGVAISPDQAHVYAASGTDQTIFALKRETNGTLTPIASYPSAQLDGVAQLRISPDGLWVYAAASNPSILNIFSRDPTTGLLKSSTPLINAQNGVSRLAGVRALTVGNDGNVYTASLVDGAVTMFRPPQANLKMSIQTDTPNPVSGQDFAYLLTIQNVGPDPSSDLQLTAQLPPALTLQNITTTQGAVCQVNSISCHLAGLDVGKSATVRVTVLPTAQGTVQFSASVSGQQIDPQPADNTAILNTAILGRADLQLSMQPDFEAIPLGNSITYKMTLTNAGPDFAENIKLNITLPTAVRFNTATLGSVLCGYQNGLVSCAVSRLDNQTELSGSLVIEPLQVGILQAQAVVSATQVDPTSPNQITALVEVTNNIINTAYDNTNKTLSGVRIGASGSVIGGVLTGKIDSNGLISKVQIAANALVSGGSLDGTIQSSGIIDNVHLNAGAQLSGGIIKGNITGSGGSLQNIHVAANAQLSGVLIGAGVVFDGAVTFGANVQFVNNTQIPANTDLTAIFATIPATGLNIQALNLSTDAVKFGTPLLSQINAIPLLSNNRMAFTQLNNGTMVLALGDGNYIYLLPVQISQTLAPTNLIINDNNSVQFITAQGRNILTQPVLAINLSNALNVSLSMQSNGNVYFPQPNNSKAIFRPSLQIIQPNIIDHFTHPIELTAIPAPLKNVSNFSMIFDDILGQRRQQILYSTAYSFNAWKTWAQKYGFELSFSPDGVVSVKVGNETHKGVFDYFITQGTPPINAELALSPTVDKNQDGISDFLITYPDGSQQILYFWF